MERLCRKCAMFGLLDRATKLTSPKQREMAAPDEVIE
jgi:hypothetical protein